MDWFAPIDLYCERLTEAFWAEPLNALSNISFLIAAGFGAKRARIEGGGIMAWVLVALAALIGIGSFLFHTFANGWSELADVLPIWSFVAIYVLALITKLKGRAPSAWLLVAVAGAAAVTLISLTLSEPSPQPTRPAPFNGSLQYAPAWIAMAVFTLVFYRKQIAERHWVLAATVAFTISLVFRSLDHALCELFPAGTHFVWHIMNGAMIGLLLQLYIRVQRPEPAVSPNS